MRRMNRAFSLCLLVAVGLALALAAAADDGGMGTLAGTVVSPGGAAVVGARVTSQGADGSHPQVTTTNAQGRFFFPDLRHGYYNVRAYSKGAWTDWKNNIEVKTGKQTEVKLRLSPKKSS
jgi:hypothetical protein